MPPRRESNGSTAADADAAHDLAPPGFGALPHEVQVLVLSHLDPECVLQRVALVCREWRELCNDPWLWWTLWNKTSGDPLPWSPRTAWKARYLEYQRHGRVLHDRYKIHGYSIKPPGLMRCVRGDVERFYACDYNGALHELGYAGDGHFAKHREWTCDAPLYCLDVYRSDDSHAWEWLACGGQSTHVELINLLTGHRFSLVEHGTSVWSVRFASATRLFSSDRAGVVLEWDLESLSPVRSFALDGIVRSINLCQNNELLVCMLRTGVVVLDVEQGNVLHGGMLPMGAAEQGVVLWHCAVTSKHIVACGSHGSTFVWDTETGRPTHAISNPVETTLYCVGEANGIVYTSDDMGFMRLHRLTSAGKLLHAPQQGRRLFGIHGHDGPVFSFFVSGRTIISCGANGRVAAWHCTPKQKAD